MEYLKKLRSQDGRATAAPNGCATPFKLNAAQSDVAIHTRVTARREGSCILPVSLAMKAGGPLALL